MNSRNLSIGAACNVLRVLPDSIPPDSLAFCSFCSLRSQTQGASFGSLAPWASKASQCNCFKPETIARRLIQWRGVGAYTKGDTFEDCYYLPRSGTDREEMIKRGKYRIYRLRLDGLPADE